MNCLEVNFRQCTYCLQTLGITCIAYSFSPLHETPDIFRHFMKCLTSRIACNIYITYTHPPSRYSNSRNFYLSLSIPWINILKTGIAFPDALISMKQPSSDSRILSALISFKRKRPIHLEAVTQDGLWPKTKQTKTKQAKTKQKLLGGEREGERGSSGCHCSDSMVIWGVVSTPIQFYI